jgi:hypothetical protein
MPAALSGIDRGDSRPTTSSGTVAWTDEQITLKDYAKPARQLTLFEHGKMVAQAISGRLDACPAELAGWLRGRWAEENSVLIPRAQKEIGTCRQELEAAQAERKNHRAKLPASDIDPAATRAIRHINRRCAQLTLRLLARTPSTASPGTSTPTSKTTTSTGP